MSHHSNHAHAHPHIIPLWVYLSIGATLMFLTLVTVGVALVDFNALLGVPHVNILVAMAIATFKATLVALFFMHLFYDNKIYLTVFLVSLLALAIFVGLTLFDTLRRAEPYAIEDKPIQQRASIYNK